MTIVGNILALLFCLLFGILAISMFLTANYLRGLILLVVILLLLPPLQTFFQRQAGMAIHPLARLVLVIVFVAIFGWSMASQKKTSIYFDPGKQAQLMKIYDAKLADWPVPFETGFVDTSYGKVHVIISGKKDSQPLLLLNAGQMAGWSWQPNVGRLGEHFRTYAIDTIGEPGKSELSDINHFPQDGKELSDLYLEITSGLGIEKAYWVGASNGGFIAANFAIHYPERMEKMVLLGPMGLTPSTNENIVRITLSQLFPLKPIQNSTLRWAFGDDPALLEQIDEWFRLVMSGTAPQQPPPRTMAAQELKLVAVPTLLVLGKKDSLMGDLNAVRRLASNVPDIDIVEIDAGHLMGMEKPQETNELILNFFGSR